MDNNSGLSVNALVGTPGIYLARYAVEDISNPQNLNKIFCSDTTPMMLHYSS
ncbi:non-canonical purine NTP pyrophosphatase [Candidatus Doolittlea endobia]|uniref:non-canonical purine NTP pyrophosphatase n=1 Tax=Candidatus Doolittlea endobia TaxID=1778262 RepID=UPI00131538D9